jgi:hypothetical protein
MRDNLVYTAPPALKTRRVWLRAGALLISRVCVVAATISQRTSERRFRSVCAPRRRSSSDRKALADSSRWPASARAPATAGPATPEPSRASFRRSRASRVHPPRLRAVARSIGVEHQRTGDVFSYLVPRAGAQVCDQHVDRAVERWHRSLVVTPRAKRSAWPLVRNDRSRSGPAGAGGRRSCAAAVPETPSADAPLLP